MSCAAKCSDNEIALWNSNPYMRSRMIKACKGPSTPGGTPPVPINSVGASCSSGTCSKGGL